MLCNLISAGEVQIEGFVAECIRCDKWIAVNLTGLICFVSMRKLRKKFNVHTRILFY
jgi:hypothetical protein